MAGSQTTVSLERRQALFLEWLLDPRSSAKPEREDPDQYKGSQNNLARRMGIAPTTLTKWKSDPRFKQAWDEAIQKVAGGPERLQQMLQELNDIALGKDKSARTADRIAAIKLHLEVVGRHQPKTIIEVKDPRLNSATDEDLLAAAERHAQAIAAAARGAMGQRSNVVRMTRDAGRKSG